MLERTEKWPKVHLKIRHFLDALMKKEIFNKDLNSIRVKFDIPIGGYLVIPKEENQLLYTFTYPSSWEHTLLKMKKYSNY